LHPSGVAKSSTSFGWGKGGNVTSAGWQVTLCDPIWYVSSRSGDGRPACKLLYAPLTLTLLLLKVCNRGVVCVDSAACRTQRTVSHSTLVAFDTKLTKRRSKRFPLLACLDWPKLWPTMTLYSMNISLTDIPVFLHRYLHNTETCTRYFHVLFVIRFTAVFFACSSS